MKAILFAAFFFLSLNVQAASTGVLVQGVNADVDQSAEDLYSAGGDISIPAAAATTTIVSASTDDAAAGTGARTVRVTGLDSNYAEISEVATMNGTSAVTLTNSFLRVNKLEVVTAGSGGTGAGAITVLHTATVIASMEAGVNASRTALWTAPATGGGYIAFKLHYVYFNVTNAAGTALGDLQVREAGGLWVTVLTIHGTANSHEFSPHMEISIPPKADVRIRVLSSSAANTAVLGGFEIEKVAR